MFGMDKDRLSDPEIAKRRDAALLRALGIPHKKQADMKVGKAKGEQELKKRKV